MNKLVLVNISIVLSHILILVNLTTSKGLHDSVSCRYLGEADSEGKRCRKDKVKFEKLPKECSAYIYDGIQCNSIHEIIPKKSDEDLDTIKSLIALEGAHDVYLFYNHISLEEFGNVIFNELGVTEAEEVKKFLGDHPVKGLILDEISIPIKLKDDDDFYKNFTAYVRAIKNVNPGLEIGFFLYARYMTSTILEWSNPNWFDFDKMNAIVDFYIIDFTYYNECVDKLLRGGITPIDSPDENIFSLNKFADALKSCTIDIKKVYFQFLISPMPKFDLWKNYSHCEISYNEYCENRDQYQSLWCADTQDTLYDKGRFAKDHASGVIGREIDLVDRDNNCNCDNKYITFFMLFHGYYGNDKLTCKAFE